MLAIPTPCRTTNQSATGTVRNTSLPHAQKPASFVVQEHPDLATLDKVIWSDEGWSIVDYVLPVAPAPSAGCKLSIYNALSTPCTNSECIALPELEALHQDILRLRKQQPFPFDVILHSLPDENRAGFVSLCTGQPPKTDSIRIYTMDPFGHR